MAEVEVKLPEIGEGVNEGEIVRWLVKEGDSISHDQPLVEVMTDKATVEIPSSASGTVTGLIAKEGDIVPVGGPLLKMEGGAAAAASPSPEKESAPAAPKEEPKSEPAPQAAAPQTPAATPPSAPAAGMDVYPPAAGADVLATPATRRYARESGVDLNKVKGTGPNGRITRDDVVKAASQGAGAVAAGPSQFAPMTFPTMTPSAGEERKPFRGIRRKIAENLVRSKQIIPHFTHADEVDVTELVHWRSQLKEQAKAQGIKLTYLPIIMKAVALTCREFPNFNASIDDNASEMVFKNYFNIGFAADTPDGLLVPVVKNVESKSILQIAHEIEVLADKARNGKASADDMRGGSITVTNIGSVGGTYATPIINHPEVCILGVYKIQKKPVFDGEDLVGRDYMGLTATCDHRIIDGAQAARFLNKLMGRLQNPQSLLLEMI